MGKEATGKAPPPWTIHYGGGGPKDGCTASSADPIGSHFIAVESDLYQVYGQAQRDDATRVIVLLYRGETFRPTPADESG